MRSHCRHCGGQGTGKCQHGSHATVSESLESVWCQGRCPYCPPYAAEEMRSDKMPSACERCAARSLDDSSTEIQLSRVNLEARGWGEGFQWLCSSCVDRLTHIRATIMQLRLEQKVAESAAKWWKVEDWIKARKKELHSSELYEFIVSLLQGE